MLPNPRNLPCNCNWRVISLVLKGLTFYVLTYYIANVGLLIIKTTQQPQSVIFSVKGQIVIPRQLRKEFGIEAGTRAVLTATDDGILLKPVTRRAIAGLHGILKRKPGDKPFAEWWADYKREERSLEDSKYARLSSR